VWSWKKVKASSRKKKSRKSHFRKSKETI